AVVQKWVAALHSVGHGHALALGRKQIAGEQELDLQVLGLVEGMPGGEGFRDEPLEILHGVERAKDRSELFGEELPDGGGGAPRGEVRVAEVPGLQQVLPVERHEHAPRATHLYGRMGVQGKEQEWA